MKISNISLPYHANCPDCQQRLQRRGGGLFCRKCNTLYPLRVSTSSAEDTRLKNERWATRVITEKFIRQQTGE